MMGGWRGWGKKQKKIMQGKMSEKKFMHGITQRKKFMHKMGRILILNQNYNSSRRVFQNAPNRIRACLDFQNFPGLGFPRTPQRKWASRHFYNGRSNLPNAECTPKQAKTNRSAIQANRSVPCTQISLKITPVSLNIPQVSLKKAQVSLFAVSSQ